MILLIIFYYVGYWKLFKKMNNKGWECLLLVYNEYLLCKKININKILMIVYLIVNSLVVFFTILYLILFLILLVLVPFLQLFVLSNSFQLIEWDSLLLGLYIYGIILVIYKLIRCYVFYELGLKFNKSKICSIVFGVFNLIGVIILGFDNSIYENN